MDRDIYPDHYYDDGKIPVFCPTMEQFQNFKTYVEATYPYGKQAGIIKIIPPSDWLQSLPNLSTKLENVTIRHPIVQHILGKSGSYTQTNIEKRKNYSVKEFRQLSLSPEYCSPGNRNSNAVPRVSPKRRRSSSTKGTSKRRASNQGTLVPIEKVDQEQLDTLKDTGSDVAQSSINIVSDASNGANKQEDINKLDTATEPTPTINPTKLRRDQRLDEAASEEFVTPEYTVDYCKELERNYWRNVTYNPPLYGADMPGSLFDETTTSWHLGHLDNILNEIDVSLPGVNSPYLYFGMWKATFPWHVEDMDLYSINFIHFGAPKQWYAIPPSQHERFERVAQGYFSQEYKKCSQFLRHKTFHISPTILAHNSIPVYKCVQKEGEFMITFPHGYHSGYNLGYNCAESVNFALENWVEIGKKAKPCKCIGDAVTIDVASIFDRKVVNETEVEKTASQKPSLIIPGKVSVDAIKDWSVFIQPRAEPGVNDQMKLPVLKLVKRDRLRQCVLCPDTNQQNLLRTDEGRWIHRLCAQFTSGICIIRSSNPDGSQVEVATGLYRFHPSINLQCDLCKSNEGYPIQCSNPGCKHRFHVSCAKSACYYLSQKINPSQSLCYCLEHRPVTAADIKTLMNSTECL